MIRAAVPAFSVVALAVAATIPAPPPTRVDAVTETVHGVAISDPYRWLEDQNSPETRVWINSQMAYTHSILDEIPGRARIRALLDRYARLETSSVPIVAGGRYFFTRRLREENQAKLYVADGLNGAPRVLVDPSPLSPGQTTAVSLLDVARDGNRIAYGLRRGGEDETTMTFLDIPSGKELADRFPRGRYFGVSISPDLARLYYSTFSSSGPRVFLHRFGSDPKSDTEIFGKEYGKDYIAGARLSEDGRYLIYRLNKGSSGQSDIYIEDVANDGPITAVAKGLDAEFQAEMGGGVLYLHTNWKAPNWHVFAVDPSHPEMERWKEVIPEGKAAMTGFSAAGGSLAASYLDDVITRVEIYSPDGKRIRQVRLPGAGSASVLRGTWESKEAFYTFTSFLSPPAVYRYNLASGSQSVWFQPKVGLDPAIYEAKQVWYASKDGTRVPMFVVAKKGVALDGTHPTLMFAYGGFNISLTPSYSPLAAAFVAQGGVYAQPNLRGGGEFGEKWHKAGMLDNKQRVFEDFFAAAEYLIALRYTSPAHLAIYGRSNGGLLMGAAFTQRPDLFRAVVCGFPLLDMLRYDRFKVARWWVPEYGSASDAHQFETLRAYSPYQFVRKGAKYPAVMFVSGDFDTRVDPLHARKMTALLQASTASGLPVLLRYDTEAGHSNGMPIAKEIDLSSDEMSFIDWQLGVSR